MAVHLIFGLLITAFGLALVYGAITNKDWLARGALGRHGQAFWNEEEQAKVIQNVGHSPLYRLVFGILGAFLALVGLFGLIHS